MFILSILFISLFGQIQCKVKEGENIWTKNNLTTNKLKIREDPASLSTGKVKYFTDNIVSSGDELCKYIKSKNGSIKVTNDGLKACKIHCLNLYSSTRRKMTSWIKRVELIFYKRHSYSRSVKVEFGTDQPIYECIIEISGGVKCKCPREPHIMVTEEMNTRIMAAVRKWKEKKEGVNVKQGNLKTRSLQTRSYVTLRGKKDDDEEEGNEEDGNEEDSNEEGNEEDGNEEEANEEGNEEANEEVNNEGYEEGNGEVIEEAPKRKNQKKEKKATKRKKVTKGKKVVERKNDSSTSVLPDPFSIFLTLVSAVSLVIELPVIAFLVVLFSPLMLLSIFVKHTLPLLSFFRD